MPRASPGPVSGSKEPCLANCSGASFPSIPMLPDSHVSCRMRLKCDGTRAENRFRLSAKQTSPFKSARGGGGGSSVDYWQPRCAHQR
jgi:hypothetical protein